MKLIIPAGGLGSRMRPFTLTKAKPLLEVAGQSVLDHILDMFEGLDISEVLIVGGYLKEQISEHLENKKIKYRIVTQKVLDGTAGAVRVCKDYVDEPCIIIFSDTLCTIDINEIKNCEFDGLHWAKEVEDYKRFGILKTDENNIMTELVEKPEYSESRLASIGLFYFKNYKTIFNEIEDIYDKNIKTKGEYFLTDAINRAIKNGQKYKVIQVEDWMDTGKHETFLETNIELLKKLDNSEKHNYEGVKIIPPVHIGENVTLTNCTIGPFASISSNAEIENATIVSSIVHNDSKVSGCNISSSIIGRNADISKDQSNSAIGDHSVIKK